MESEFNIQNEEKLEQIVIKEEVSLSPGFIIDDEDDDIANGNDDDDMDYSPRHENKTEAQRLREYKARKRKLKGKEYQVTKPQTTRPQEKFKKAEVRSKSEWMKLIAKEKRKQNALRSLMKHQSKSVILLNMQAPTFHVNGSKLSQKQDKLKDLLAEQLKANSIPGELLTNNIQMQNPMLKQLRSITNIQEYIGICIEKNIPFLTPGCDSAEYYSQREKDLLDTIRLSGIPTASLTMSANHCVWPDLLKLLHKFKNSGINQDYQGLNLISNKFYPKDTLTDAIYFNKVVDVVLNILQSEESSAFGKYKVVKNFKRIVYSHSHSPEACILLWLDNAPKYPLHQDYDKAISLIGSLFSVSSNNDVFGNIKIQCCMDRPFFPSKSNIILTPMDKSEPKFHEYATKYENIKNSLEVNDYEDFNSYYESNNIVSDQQYNLILSAGIKRPMVFYQRKPSEKWYKPYNPFLFNLLKSNVDFQFFPDEYSCANYISCYINKNNSNVDDLYEKITNENLGPGFEFIEIRENHKM